MAWVQVDVAIEEIGVEVVDDLLHFPGRDDGFVRALGSDPPLSPLCITLQARTPIGNCLTLVLLHAAVSYIHDGIFPEAGKIGVEVPVDGLSGTPLLKHCGLLSLTRKAKPRTKEAVVRFRVELGDNGGVGQAILAVEDDVVDLVVELATGGFPGPS
ncbi:unnamed protein product [Heligmosomoides polygyrus]|uniref:MaoC-like domain-containing protein n=1 Tax=Heligmosomoides polygyrus TaxID=6339 RepID=A0A183FGR1_HELPZ|nr:unnamed protein product [Heligmosomoides polygyrus]